MEKPNFDTLRISGTSNKTTCATDLLCPHCGYYAPANGVVMGEGDFVVACHQCKESIFIQVDKSAKASVAGYAPESIIDYYPKRKITVDTLVEPDIANDYLGSSALF